MGGLGRVGVDLHESPSFGVYGFYLGWREVMVMMMMGMGLGLEMRLDRCIEYE